MAKKVLGQGILASGNTWLTPAIYTVPSARETVISSITICNQSSIAGTYRIAVRPAGATLAARHYIAYDVTVAGNDTTTITLGITLAATDVLDVYASTTNISFSVFGNETTV